MTGKMYLAAYAEGIGASAFTFYDDIATAFFSRHTREKGRMMALGFGSPGYRAKPSRIFWLEG